MSTYYIDTSATNHGDGSSPAQAGSPGGVGAYKTFVAGAVNDVFWVRRVSRASAATWHTTSPTIAAGQKYIGWPIAGDEHYAVRPAAGTSQGWDADSTSYFGVLKLSGSGSFLFNQAGHETHRIEFSAITGHTTGVLLNFGNSAGTVAKLRSCNVWQEDLETLGNNTRVVRFTGWFDVDGLTGTIGTAGSGSAANVVYVDPVSGAPSTLRNVNLLIKGSNTPVGGVFYVVPGASSFLLIDGLTLTWTGTHTNWKTPLYQMLSSGGTASGLHVRNLTLVATGASIQESMQWVPGDSNGVLQDVKYEHVKLTNIHFVTGSTIQLAMLDIAEWTEAPYNTTLTFYVLLMTIMKSTLNPTNSGTWTFSENTLLLTRGADMPASLVFSGDGNSQAKWYSTDHDGVDGAFYARARDMFCYSSSVVRSGGSAFSIRVEPLSGSTRHSRALGLFGPEERESVFVYRPAGTYTITFYMAYKSFAGLGYPTKAHLRLTARHLDGGVGQTRIVDQEVYPFEPFASDGSSWSGDTVTGIKCSVTITTGRAGLIELQLLAGWPYGEAGVLYVDPTPAVA